MDGECLSMGYDTLIIWRDVAVLVRRPDGKLELGDLPVCTLNEITGKFEPVENRRGRAYASRKQLRYRRKKGRRSRCATEE